MRTSVKRNLAPQQPEPQEPKSPPVPLESLEDIAWELWLLIELLAPVRRRLPNTASQKLVDYVKDRLIAKSVALAKWKKARPELFPDSPIRARDVLPGENWIFPDHRTFAEVIQAERNPATVLSQRLPDPLLGSEFHAKRFRFVRLGPQAIGSGKGSLEFSVV